MRPLVLLLALLPAAVAADELPRVELYTMGSGDDVFEAFGHSALCYFDEGEPRGLCYNYGTADFSDPVRLIWDVLRGRARFFVSRTLTPRMVESYIEDDRTIYRQKLDLPADEARALGARLAHDHLPANRFYTYRHYRDNCATRLRDHLDAVTGGRLSAGSERPFGRSFRQLTQAGFARSIWLLLGMEVLVGRQVDRQPTLWEAMFLPSVMRAVVAERLGAAPIAIYTRQGRMPALDPLAGRRALLATALLLTLLVAIGGAARSERAFRAAIAVAGAIIGTVGVLVAATAAVATLVELRQNEVLLVCLPTDLALIFLRGRGLFGYLVARLALAALVAAGMLAGVLVQPMWAAWALAAGPMAVATLRAHRALA